MALQFCELFSELQSVSPILSCDMIRRDSGILSDENVEVTTFKSMISRDHKNGDHPGLSYTSSLFS